MAYEYIDRAKAALEAGDLNTAIDAMFNPGEGVERRTADELRDWAEGERSTGYGLRAELLERYAGLLPAIATVRSYQDNSWTYETAADGTVVVGGNDHAQAITEARAAGHNGPVFRVCN